MFPGSKNFFHISFVQPQFFILFQKPFKKLLCQFHQLRFQKGKRSLSLYHQILGPSRQLLIHTVPSVLMISLVRIDIQPLQEHLNSVPFLQSLKKNFCALCQSSLKFLIAIQSSLRLLILPLPFTFICIEILNSPLITLCYL